MNASEITYERIKTFHAHLDVCSQCERHPFALCPTGAKLLKSAATGEPIVLNKKTDKIPPDAVYVGRPSKWGNPFKIGIDGTREEVISKYKQWMMSVEQAYLVSYLTELKGKDLVCWCAPLPCHADVLLEIANGGI